MSFPRDKLRADDKALVLFCAHFGGAQDASHFSQAGVKNVECWDLNGEKLAEMLPLYPKPWLFIEGDAFKKIDDAKPTPHYDVISCDQFSNHDADVLTRVPKLLQMARRLVLVGWCAGGAATPQVVHAAFTTAAEAGWRIEIRPRSRFSGGCVWIVFEKVGA